ncbi:lytic transglycosylase domain-containing protein [Azohydromonas australica]|uniref:lytic transglycosylase domain-containing protein n=1 Tax=Azohydromonas australica TaxID=364039 RepID=UPI00040229F6|nr:lytic transglycosylase domain-containing protein [Azohydromonas australica]
MLTVEALLALAMLHAPVIHPNTVARIVEHESGRQPLAIGVNGASLEHQPRSLAQAINTARALRAQGYDFDAGLCQINVRNFHKLGLDEVSVFDPAENLRACQTVLLDCFRRAPSPDPQAALRQALSCFNSGNHQAGFASGYVSRVVNVPAPIHALASKEHSR